MSRYGLWGQAFRTQYGFTNWIREASKVLMWGGAGFFWVFTLTGTAFSFELFARITTYILMIETFMTLRLCVSYVASFFLESDQYEVAHQHHTPYTKSTGGPGIQIWFKEGMDAKAGGVQKFDWDFQFFSIVVQFVAYPLIQIASVEGVA